MKSVALWAIPYLAGALSYAVPDWRTIFIVAPLALMWCALQTPGPSKSEEQGTP